MLDLTHVNFHASVRLQPITVYYLPKVQRTSYKIKSVFEDKTIYLEPSLFYGWLLWYMGTHNSVLKYESTL